MMGLTLNERLLGSELIEERKLRAVLHTLPHTGIDPSTRLAAFCLTERGSAGKCFLQTFAFVNFNQLQVNYVLQCQKQNYMTEKHS